MGAANLSLPSEIVEEILALLPQQSIHRFRSVSKSWSSLLVSVEFHKLRSRSSPPEINVQKLLHHYRKYYPHGANSTSYYGFESLDFRNGQSKNDEVWFPTAREFVRFAGSCNGLVCVTQFARYHHACIRGIAVWNPFTGVYRKLPKPLYTSGPDHYGLIPRSYGFGHDSVGDDYKVFLAARRSYLPITEDPLPIVQIFSLKTGSWKIVENHSRYLHQLLHDRGRGLYLNGALYWESWTGKRIIAFDLVEEKFSDVRAPVVERSYEHVSMGIVGEYLCMCWHPMGNNREMVVWVMKEHGNWVPFIQYSEGTRQLVAYECNFIPPAVKNRGYMMLYFHEGQTEVLQWNNNHGGRKQYKFYEKSSSIPYTEALTSPYPTASEVDFRT
ncbi:hypothetical protein Tsubulata_028338 [Turnera subulata]|uniref:F-box domain-containing protein n=1 Tax=Turnera subulata TaxID=218843 RepID=A0A9Q0G0Z5_9ROSI|nr:hypothetical protein Tsubulata_028338 [Turnera subulata]